MSYATKVTYMPVISAGIDPAHPRAVKMPDFPEQEMRAAASGFSVLSFTIKVNGTVSDVKIEAGNGEDFGANARTAVASWRFFPAKNRDNGKETESIMRARIDFLTQEVEENLPGDPVTSKK